VPEPGIGRPDIGKTKRKIPPAWGVARNLAHAAQTHLLRIFRGSFSEIGRLTSQIIVIRRRTFAVMRPTTIQSREDLLALLRDRREELDLSLEVLAEIAGLPARYPNKLLSLKPTRNLGPLSMSVILGALALKIVRVEIVVDEEAAAKMAGRWTPRKRAPVHKPLCVAKPRQRVFDFVEHTDGDVK
jgi:hypothetical protein